MNGNVGMRGVWEGRERKVHRYNFPRFYTLGQSQKVDSWVKEMKELCKPEKVFVFIFLFIFFGGGGWFLVFWGLVFWGGFGVLCLFCLVFWLLSFSIFWMLSFSIFWIFVFFVVCFS